MNRWESCFYRNYHKCTDQQITGRDGESIIFPHLHRSDSQQRTHVWVWATDQKRTEEIKRPAFHQNVSVADSTRLTCFKSRKAAWWVGTVTFRRVVFGKQRSQMWFTGPVPQRSVSIIRENLRLLTPDSRLPDPSVPASGPRPRVCPSSLARWRSRPWSGTPGAPWPGAAPRSSPWPLARTPKIISMKNDISFQIDNYLGGSYVLICSRTEIKDGRMNN